MFGKRRTSQTFANSELRAVLETSLGFRLRALTPLKSVNALNFKAVREGDGFVFTVKCMPTWRRIRFEQLLVHLREMEGSKAVARLFARECPRTFGDYDLVCLTWCEGSGIPADRLTETQLIGFIEDYRAFSDAMQGASRILPQYPFSRWREEAVEKCRGSWGRLLRPLIEMAEPDLSGFREDRLRVTHGDLHPGNFAFKDGRVSGFFDIEEFTWGYPAWDILRYFVFSCEHLHVFERRRRRRLFDHFRTAVRHLPYPCDEWIAAINACWLERVNKKLHGRAPGPLQVLQLHAAAGTYRRLREIVFDIIPA